MSALEPASAVFVASLGVLATAGVAKIVKPADTSRALRIAGWPAQRWLVRLGATGEVAIAAAALAEPGHLTGTFVAAAYAGFAAFVGLALIKGWPLASCGCFGRPDTKPGLIHLLLDLGAAGCAVWWALRPPGDTAELLRGQPWGGAAMLVVSATIAWLAYLIWTRPSLRTS